MPDYRLYSMSANNIAGPPQIVQCASDQQAIAAAKGLLDRHDIEIWQGARVVTRLQPSDKIIHQRDLEAEKNPPKPGK
jgi:hypothetical protein